MADEKKQKGQQQAAQGKPQGKKGKPEQVEASAEQPGGKPARPKATNRATARLRDRYVKEVRPALMKEFNLENPMAARNWRRSWSTWAWATRRRTQN